MSLIKGPSGFVFAGNDSYNQNVAEDSRSRRVALPIETKFVSSSVSKKLLETIARTDPKFARFLEANPQLFDLLDSSVSRSVKGSVIANFVRERPFLDQATINKLVSLSQDLPFATMIGRQNVLNSQQSISLEKINRILGNDIYDTIVDQNLVSGDIPGIIQSVFPPNVISKLKQNDISALTVANLLAPVLPLASGKEILENLEFLWSPERELPIETPVVENFVAPSTTQDVGKTRPDTATATNTADVFISGGSHNTMNHEQKTQGDLGETYDQSIAPSETATTVTRQAPTPSSSPPGSSVLPPLSESTSDSLGFGPPIVNPLPPLPGRARVNPLVPLSFDLPLDTKESIQRELDIVKTDLDEEKEDTKNIEESQAKQNRIAGLANELDKLEGEAQVDSQLISKLDEVYDQVITQFLDEQDKFGVDLPIEPNPSRVARSLPTPNDLTEENLKKHQLLDESYTKGAIGSGLYMRAKARIPSGKATKKKQKRAPKKKTPSS